MYRGIGLDRPKSKIVEFIENVDLIKGRVRPEGSKSPDGKQVKRGGKWVPVKSNRKSPRSTITPDTDAVSVAQDKVSNAEAVLRAADKPLKYGGKVSEHLKSILKDKVRAAKAELAEVSKPVKQQRKVKPKATGRIEIENVDAVTGKRTGKSSMAYPSFARTTQREQEEAKAKAKAKSSGAAKSKSTPLTDAKWDKVPDYAVDAVEWALKQIDKKGLNVTIHPMDNGNFKIKSGKKTRTIETSGIRDILNVKVDINLAVSAVLKK